MTHSESEAILYLGSIWDLTEKHLREYDIDVVLSITWIANSVKGKLGNIDHHIFDITETPNYQGKLDILMPEICDIIDSALKDGKNVLVHCNSGLHRSPTVVCYYLQHTGMSVEESLGTIKVKKPFALIYRPFRLIYKP